MKKLDAASPGLINHSVFLILFEDMALTEFCEIIVPSVFAVFIAFVYFICPNRKYFMLFNEENFDVDALVRTEFTLISYIAIEVLSFIIKQHYIFKEFSIDLVKLLHFSLSKHGIQLGCMIWSCFIFAILSMELEHIRNDWTLEIVKECLASSHTVQP